MDSKHSIIDGFTLVEVMIAISVMAILIFGGVPSFIQLIRDTSVSTQSNSLVAAIGLARSEAVRRGVDVHLTAVTDDKNETAWSNGWVIWVDSDNDNARESSEVLRNYKSPDGELVLDKNVTDIVFNSQGEIRGGGVYTFQLKPPGCQAQEKREIKIKSTGRPSITKVDCEL